MIELSNSDAIRVLEHAFCIKISDRLDSVDISWNGIFSAFNMLGEYEKNVISLRYSGLTYAQVGKNINGKISGLPVSRETARQKINFALRKIRSGKIGRAIRSSISPPWILGEVYR